MSRIPTLDEFKQLSFQERISVLQSLMKQYKIAEISAAWGFKNPNSYYHFLRSQGLHSLVVGRRGRRRKEEDLPIENSSSLNRSMGSEKRMLGIVRTLDDLGRVVIPQEIRDILGFGDGFPLEIYEDEAHDRVVLKPYRQIGVCMDCGSTEDVIPFKRLFLCRSCMRRIMDALSDHRIVN